MSNKMSPGLDSRKKNRHAVKRCVTVREVRKLKGSVQRCRFETAPQLRANLCKVPDVVDGVRTNPLYLNEVGLISRRPAKIPPLTKKKTKKIALTGIRRRKTRVLRIVRKC